MRKPPSNKIDMIGKVYGKLVVLKQVSTKKSQPHYLCKCDCGNEKIIAGASLRHGHTKSCGCIWQEKVTKHGFCGTKVYTSWQGMKHRCDCKSNPKYHIYGGAGITYDPRWHSFEQFLSDMGKPPSDQHTLDRIDGTKGYYKENCRWATYSQQSVNTRKRKNCSSQYKGVCWDKSRKKWVAICNYKHLGRFSNEAVAAKAYDEKATELWGNDAVLNFPDSNLTQYSPSQPSPTQP